MYQELFVKATRLKFKFPSSVGEIDVIDLWDLPLEHRTKPSLDYVYINLNKQIKEAEQSGGSYFTTQTKECDLLNEKLAIVKYIMDTKLAENQAATKRKENNDLLQTLLGIQARQQEQSLLNLSSDELKLKIAELQAQ